jgi:AraC-like DNA-binding protein
MPAFLTEKSRVYLQAFPEELSAYINQHIGPHEMQLPNKRGAVASMLHCRGGKIDICHLAFGAETRIFAGELRHHYHLHLILRGTCSYETSKGPALLTSGQAWIILPGETVDLTYSADCEQLMLRIPSEIFNEVCLEHGWPRPIEHVEFNRTPYSIDELKNLNDLLTIFCQEAESDGAVTQTLQYYSRVIVSKLLTTLKHDICMDAPEQQSGCFTRLVQFIDDNIKKNITADDLAKFAKISPRSLYLIFEKNAQTTPKNFIRQKKLEQVYLTLMNPAHDLINVTAVAMDYGFYHLGRFSEFYKTTYGILPSQSLRGRAFGKLAR